MWPPLTGASFLAPTHLLPQPPGLLRSPLGRLSSLLRLKQLCLGLLGGSSVVLELWLSQGDSCGRGVGPGNMERNQLSTS